MVWWLNEEFPSLNFRVERTGDERVGLGRITESIDANSPILVTNHARTAGHIILVIGCEPFGRAGGPHLRSCLRIRPVVSSAEPNGGP